MTGARKIVVAKNFNLIVSDHAQCRLSERYPSFAHQNLVEKVRASKLANNSEKGLIKKSACRAG